MGCRVTASRAHTSMLKRQPFLLLLLLFVLLCVAAGGEAVLCVLCEWLLSVCVVLCE